MKIKQDIFLNSDYKWYVICVQLALQEDTFGHAFGKCMQLALFYTANLLAKLTPSLAHGVHGTF